MSKVLGGVVRWKSKQGELYYIHLETDLNVSAHISGVKKIQLIQDELYKDEMEYIAELQKRGEISKGAFNKLKEIYESRNFQKAKKMLIIMIKLCNIFKSKRPTQNWYMQFTPIICQK